MAATEQKINVTIKQLDGTMFGIRCSSDMTVLGLKTLIADARNIIVDRQRLIFRAQELLDDQTLAHYSVIEGSILHIVIRPLNNNNINNNINMASALQPEGQYVVDMGNNGQMYGGVAAPDHFRRVDMAPPDSDVITIAKLCRFVKIFALIDAIFLILYGLSYALCFLLAALAFAGYFGARNLSRASLIAYIFCLLFEIVIRIYLITLYSSVFEGILLVLMILIDLFVCKCTYQLQKQIPLLSADQRDSVLILNRMSVC